MAYSTGSGTHTQMMDAVLSHALADGWSEIDGVGTGFPISKGNIRAIDFDFNEVNRTDYTGINNIAKVERRLRFGIGTTGAAATADLANDNCLTPNMEYVITQWHIFSDPLLCDYIHVAFAFSTGSYAQVWGHFGFGELDSQGHSGHVAYVTGQYATGYARGTVDWNDFWSPSGTPDGADWLHPAEAKVMFGGRVGNRRVANSVSNFKYILDGSDLPVDVGSGWPAADTVYAEGLTMLMNNHPTQDTNRPANRDTGFQSSTSINHWAALCQPQPFSGSVTLAAMPMLITNGTSSALKMVQSGIAPNVRLCSMEGYNAGNEVNFGGDTWVLFPFLRQTPDSEIGVARTVASGSIGYAYKKVL
jgi:hypothetical protein